MALVFNDGITNLNLSTKYEILYPLDVKRTTIDFEHRGDDNIWRQGKKIDGVISSKIIYELRLALRISRDQFGSLLNFLDANYNTQFTIQADGYDLFDDGNRGAVNNVRLNNYDNPIREFDKFYRIDINLVKV